MALQLEGRFKTKPAPKRQSFLYCCNQQGLLYQVSIFEVCAINGLGGESLEKWRKSYFERQIVNFLLDLGLWLQ